MPFAFERSSRSAISMLKIPISALPSRSQISTFNGRMRILPSGVGTTSATMVKGMSMTLCMMPRCIMCPSGVISMSRWLSGAPG